jgi:Zn-dependent protease
MFGLSPAELLKVIPAILAGLTVHELAHAWVALRLGDDTPRLMGRVSWNPLKHVDLFGFIMLVVAGFGWAKPVMINRANLKKPVRDDILIALAGPFSNLAFSLLGLPESSRPCSLWPAAQTVTSVFRCSSPSTSPWACSICCQSRPWTGRTWWAWRWLRRAPREPPCTSATAPTPCWP